jgi:hypothetical protein
MKGARPQTSSSTPSPSTASSKHHERVTAPSPALVLHVVQHSETGETIAWWDDLGMWLVVAGVGTS